MKCDSCGKTLSDEIIVFCEKCEKYYCMNCYTKHKRHKLVFKRLTDDIITNINTGELVINLEDNTTNILKVQTVKSGTK